MSLEHLKKEIAAQAELHKQVMTMVAQQLYEFPETGLHENRAAQLLCDLLVKNGFEVERNIGGMETAFRGNWGTGSPTIAILAEMDALPTLGHACGHNIIAGAALGAALLLRSVLDEHQGRVVMLGTPAEELGIGKVDLVSSGYFSDVDFAMMVHPSSRRQVVKGYLALAKLRFRFRGKASHAAAYPEEGINALDAVIQTFNGINALRQQARQDVRIHGIVTEGGIAPNIIPEVASCYFYVRAADLDETEAMTGRVIDCAEGAARATGCGLEVVREGRLLAPFKIIESYSRLYAEQLRYLGLEEYQAPPDRNRGSSDIGNVSQVVPTIHPHVPIGDGLHIHTPEFARATVSEKGREAVVEGAVAMALTAAELLFSPQTRKKIEDEFSTAQ